MSSPFSNLPPHALERLCSSLDPKSLVFLMNSCRTVRHNVAEFTANTFWRAFARSNGIPSDSTLVEESSVDDDGRIVTVAHRMIRRENRMRQNKCTISKVDVRQYKEVVVVEKDDTLLANPSPSSFVHFGTMDSDRPCVDPILPGKCLVTRRHFWKVRIDSLVAWDTTKVPPTKLQEFPLTEVDSTYAWKQYIILVPRFKDFVSAELTLFSIYDIRDHRKISEVKIPIPGDYSVTHVSKDKRIFFLLLKTPLDDVKAFVRSAHLPLVIFVCSIPDGAIEHRIHLPDSLKNTWFVTKNMSELESRIPWRQKILEAVDNGRPHHWLVLAVGEHGKSVSANLVTTEFLASDLCLMPTRDGTLVIMWHRLTKEQPNVSPEFYLVHQTFKNAAAGESITLEAEHVLSKRDPLKLGEFFDYGAHVRDWRMISRWDVEIILLQCSFGQSRDPEVFCLGIQYEYGRPLKRVFRLFFDGYVHICPMDQGLQFALLERSEPQKYRSRDGRFLRKFKKCTLYIFDVKEKVHIFDVKEKVPPPSSFFSFTSKMYEERGGTLSLEVAAKKTLKTLSLEVAAKKRLKDPDVGVKDVVALHVSDGDVFIGVQEQGPQGFDHQSFYFFIQY